MTSPLQPPSPGLDASRLEIALLCLEIFQRHQITITGMEPRTLLQWAGVPEEHLTPTPEAKALEVLERTGGLDIGPGIAPEHVSDVEHMIRSTGPSDAWRRPLDCR